MRVVRGKLFTPDVIRGCGFYDPISLKTYMITIINFWLLPVFAQKFDLTDTPVPLETRQIGAKFTFTS